MRYNFFVPVQILRTGFNTRAVVSEILFNDVDVAYGISHIDTTNTHVIFTLTRRRSKFPDSYSC